MSIGRKESGPGGVIHDLYRGIVRWDLLFPFPKQADSDRDAGTAALQSGEAWLNEVAEHDVQDTARLDSLKAYGLLGLSVPPPYGLGLSAYNVFRLVTRLAEVSRSAATVVASNHGFGASAYRDLLPHGDLLEAIHDLERRGYISGDADTEPTGAANGKRETSAVPTEDGRGYLLTGRKVYVQNGPIADMIQVTGTILGGREEELGIFFVDTSSDGVSVGARHEFLGLAGGYNCELVFDGVHVPRSHVLGYSDVSSRAGVFRTNREYSSEIASRARMTLLSAVSLAVTRLCAAWSTDFAHRRFINGYAIASFELIQRALAKNKAAEFSIRSVTQWLMLSAPNLTSGADLRAERAAAKNVVTLQCWFAADRTISIMGALGLETEASKLARSVPSAPVEEAFRDARMLRVAGGVDFYVHFMSARNALLATHYSDTMASVQEDSSVGSPTLLKIQAGLNGHNRLHLEHVDDETASLADLCRRVVSKYDAREEMLQQQQILFLLSSISNELFGIVLQLSHAATHFCSDSDVQAVVDVSCRESFKRIEEAKTELKFELGAGEGLGSAYVTASDVNFVDL